MTSIYHDFPDAHLIRNKATGKGRNDPLPRLLAQLIARAGKPAWIDRSTSRPWASALFEGRRHCLLLRIGGADGLMRTERFVEGLESAQWLLSGHFVADISIDAISYDIGGVKLELSALTIQDW